MFAQKAGVLLVLALLPAPGAAHSDISGRTHDAIAVNGGVIEHYGDGHVELAVERARATLRFTDAAGMDVDTRRWRGNLAFVKGGARKGGSALTSTVPGTLEGRTVQGARDAARAIVTLERPGRQPDTIGFDLPAAGVIGR